MNLLKSSKEFKCVIKKHKGKTIKNIQSDWGGDFFNTKFNELIKDHAFLSQLTPSGISELNRVLRRNHILLDMVLSMMSYMDLLIFS